MQITNHPAPPLANNHISVDCTVFGFDGIHLNVLLIRRDDEDNGQTYHDMKLPGSLIYQDEDLDQAAHRVLRELTGLDKISLSQFKAFGSKDRTSDPRDVRWLERAQHERVERIVTIAYMALVKLDRPDSALLELHNAAWVPVTSTGPLAFDHNQIISEALTCLRNTATADPSRLFEFLPRKFTAARLRSLYEAVYNTKIDVRNFHKKLSSMQYVIPLEEKETGVAHRAARYYKFDRKIYNRMRR